ncbi:Riboflavin transporter [Jannaschia aquimarina]|uniref:RibN_2 protein n=2 Tax=Jannaschia aquimarina TaxID=935700 RepID=A0A0D1EFI6_9RHOB|nr:DMT family transporter [Jannaschia aquimarina]KIT16409.1 Riboflavin transporter [Jannaschia aquimarina]SNS91571.1 EamA domain-containing membrane protein RarD [Jannaschia aquimarina]
MVAASAFIAGTTLLAKALGTDALGPPLTPVQVAWGRFAFAALGVLAVAAFLRPQVRWAHWPWHAGRVVLGATGVTFMFAAAALMPLAEATAISFLNPVVAMLLAIPILGERVGPWRWLAAATALAGALILLRPGGEAIQIGAAFALGAALALGAEVMFIKRLTRMDGPLVILMWSNGIGVVLASLAVLIVWQAPTPAQWAGLAALGLTMAAAQGCFVQSMRRADASYVTPFTYLTLVFAGLYDAALFGVLPDAVGWTGAALILAGAALLAWREGRISATGSSPHPPAAGSSAR